MPDLTTPITQTTTCTITRFEINVSKVILNTSADLEILLFNGDQFIDVKIVQLTGTEYDNWGLDDSYLINYCENWINANL